MGEVDREEQEDPCTCLLMGAFDGAETFGKGRTGQEVREVPFRTCNRGSELSQVSLRPKPGLNPTNGGRAGRSWFPWPPSTFLTFLPRLLPTTRSGLGPWSRW